MSILNSAAKILRSTEYLMVRSFHKEKGNCQWLEMMGEPTKPILLFLIVEGNEKN